MTRTRTSIAVLSSLLALASAAEARRPVFSFTDNRVLAHHARRGGLYIEAGGPGMAKYIHFSRPIAVWKIRQKEEGRRVALAQAQVAVEVPLDAATASAAKNIYLGLKAPASTVKVTVGGKTTAPVMLKPGWQIVTVPLPDALKAGENTIKFGFANYGTFAGQKAAAAIEFIQVGGSAPAQADAKLADKAGFRLPGGSSVTWYGFVPARGAGVLANGDAGGCNVTFSAAADGSKAFSIPLKLDGSEHDISGSGLAGRFAALTITAAGSGCETKLAGGALLVEGDKVTRPGSKPPKNVIIWLTDDTRADKYKMYNPKSRVVTPVFDELAKSSTVFRWAYTQGNESRVSHASLFSGMYPSVHNMIADKAVLDSKFVILPEAVKPAGRYTIGIMGNGYISKRWGFGDGWDFFKNNIHEGGGLSGDALWLEAKKVLDGPANNKPFFLYIGSIDSHVSWRAHEPWISQYDPNPYNGPFVKALADPVLDKIVLGKMSITERDKVRTIALYDSDISYNDAVMGKLIEDMKKRGVWDETLFIITSDHGEEFWDHGRIGHGQSLRQELVHVPMLVRYPGLVPGGRVVEEGVDVLDVLPTVTDALGVNTPDAVQGESMIPLALGINAGYPRPAIASQYELAHAMQLGKYKIWVGGSGEVHLYDAEKDLREDNDLAVSRPVERRALTDALGTWMAFRNQWRKRYWGVASNQTSVFADEVEK